jgi:hypothetical protein
MITQITGDQPTHQRRTATSAVRTIAAGSHRRRTATITVTFGATGYAAASPVVPLSYFRMDRQSRSGTISWLVTVGGAVDGDEGIALAAVHYGRLIAHCNLWLCRECYEILGAVP